jgi:hypothetical protein
VANDIAELAVVVLFTADGVTVGSLVAVTVLMLGSVLLLLVLILVLLLLVLVLILVLFLVVVTILGLLVVVVAFAVPEVLLGCAFEVCVVSVIMHVTSVACFCFRLVHKKFIATIVVVVVVVVAFLATAILVLRGIVVVLVVVTAFAPTFVGLVACLAAGMALDLALATVLLIDVHFVVVRQSSGHPW